MVDIIIFAIPVFILFLALEIASYYWLPDDEERGYNVRDSATSISMGLGNVAINLGWKIVVLAIYTALYLIAPVHLSASNPWTWVALFLLDDLAFYWYHRTHHEIRMFWASHVVHHSSEHYNLSTALRQPVAGAFGVWVPYGLPAAVGVRPSIIETSRALNLIYQYWIHTDLVGKLGPLERWFNTASHHRVHHGSNPRYIDRNHGSILIVWDRLFGTFEPEGERVRYGLTKDIDTFNPVRVAFHEWVAIWRDVRAASSWRDRLGYMFKGPGWRPEASEPRARSAGGRRSEGLAATAPAPRADRTIGA